MGFNKKISRQSKVKFNDINHELEDSVNTGLEERVDQLEDNIENNIEVSGAAAIINDAAPMIVSSLITNITAYQEGSGDPSPDNVRPISGSSEVDIVRNGFNQFDEVVELGGIDSQNGENETSNSHMRSKNYISVIPNKNYYCNGDNAFAYVMFYQKDYSYNGYVTNKSNAIITIPDEVYYIRFVTTTSYGTTYNNDICINISDTTKNGTYEPYKGEEVAIALGQTVYGGTLDVNEGLLTITHGIVDLGSLDYTRNTSYTNAFYVASIAGIKNISNIISSNFKTYTPSIASYFGVNAPNNSCCKSSNITEFIFIRADNYADATDFKTAMNGAQLVYELANHTTIQLTPVQIKLLEDYNVVMANSGDVELTYQPNNELGKSLVPISERIDTELSLRPILKSASISGTTSEGGLLSTTITGVPLFVDLSDGTDKLTASFLYGEDDVIVIKSEVSTVVTGTLYYL